MSQISSSCRGFGPQCAEYPTGSSGYFYWTTSPGVSTFAAATVQNGGTASSPVSLAGNVGQLLGSISSGETEWYQFNWGGGVFNTSALIETTGGSFTLLLGDGALFGNILASQTLDSADGFTGGINMFLAPGTYGIGLSEAGSSDPNFLININQVPEPASLWLVLAGMLALPFTKRLRARQ